MKPLIIYHGNCADGFAAAWCFWKKYGSGADYHAGVYQQDPPDVTGRAVYLVDFSYKRPVVEQMLAVAESVTLIDHHKTAIEDLRPLFRQDSYTGGEPQLNWFIDLERSGAKLAWDYLFPGESPPRLIEHIQDRDLWQFKLNGTREIQAYVFSHPYDFGVWDELMKENIEAMQDGGEAIERKHHKDVAELVGVCKRHMFIGGHYVPVASMPYTMGSDAGHLMAIGEPFSACYWDTAEGRVFGLRSADDGLDVSEIAKKYGGGGHKHAAGFKVPRDHDLAMS
jgi:oligoribonuclease NrnB/cAMP/cGMP phosphodiesterase (DHH superfamily)